MIFLFNLYQHLNHLKTTILNPITKSADAPMASPPATPAPTISFLTMSFNNCDFILPDTVGAPNVLLCVVPYGLLPSFLYGFLKPN